MKKTKITILAATMVAFCGLAQAQTAESSDGYLTDSWGKVVKSSTSNLCVQTSSYDKNKTMNVDCDIIEKPAVIIEPKPEKRVESKIQKVQKQFMAEVHFEFNKFVLSSQDKMKLDRLKNEMTNNPNIKVQNVVVLGHADPIGKNKLNIPLSQNRANVVAEYLGSDFAPVATYSLGSDMVKVDCGNTATKKNIECNSENRRTKVVVNTVIDMVVNK